MNYQSISAAIILVLTVGVSAYDVLPALSDPEGDTISAVLRAWSRDWIVIPYLYGVLGGHWFLGHDHAITDPHGDLYITVWTMWLMLIVSLAFRRAEVDVPAWGYLACMAVGVAVGHWFWSQA
jgi:hypothetical protein